MHTLRRHPRYWSLATWLLVVGGLALGGLSVFIGAQPAIEKQLSTDQAVAVNDLTKNIDVDYPVLQVPQVDSQLKAFAEKQTKAFAAKLEKRQYDARNKLTLNCTVSHYSQRLLSVVFTKKLQIADKKPVTSYYRQVFDVTTGKKLVVRDLFREDAAAEAVFANIFYDYFRQDEKVGLSLDQQLKMLDFKFSDVHDFMVFEDSLVFYLNPKDLANKKQSSGVRVNKSVVGSVLKSDYQAVEANKKLDTPPKNITYTITELPKRSVPNVGSGKRIALTFDDGPSEHTGRLLDTLAKYRSRATFYVLGHLAQAYSGDLQRMVRDQQEIGNHSWLHANLTQLSQAQLDHEIGDTQRAIQSATGGYTPRTVRPPYGATSDATRSLFAAHGLHETLWSVDTNDWQMRDSQVIYDRIMGGAADGQVILLHDIYGSSVDAAIRAIPVLLARGYQLVTVSELYGY